REEAGRARSDAVAGGLHARAMGAVRTAEERAIRLHAMTDDPTSAVVAGGRERVDRALEAVEHVPLALGDDLNRLVVVVPAHLAFGHDCSPLRLPMRVYARRHGPGRRCDCRGRAAAAPVGGRARSRSRGPYDDIANRGARAAHLP